MQVRAGQDTLQCLSLSLRAHRMFLHSHVSENPLQVGVPQASLGAGVLGASRKVFRAERQGWASHCSTAQARLSTPQLCLQISEHSLLPGLNIAPCACSSISTKGQRKLGCDTANSLTRPLPAREALQGSVIVHLLITVIPSLANSNVLLYAATV